MPAFNVDLPEDLYAAIDEYTGRRAGQLQKREAAIQAWTAWVALQRKLDQEDDRERATLEQRAIEAVNALVRFAPIDQMALVVTVLAAFQAQLKIPKGELRRRSATPAHRAGAGTAG